MDLSKIADPAALPKEIRVALERLPELEARVAALEARLAGDLCPKCKMPGWHEISNKPAQVGEEFGLVEVTMGCLRCGYQKVQPPS